MLLKNRKHLLLDIIRLPVTVAPGAAFLKALHTLIMGILPTFQVYATARFVDAAISAARGAPFQTVLLPIGGLAGIITTILLLEYAGGFISNALSFALQRRIKTEMLVKRSRLEYSQIESAVSWDLIRRVSEEPELRVYQGYMGFLSLAALIIRIAGLLWLVFLQVWWAALVLALLSAPLLWAAVKGGKEGYQGDRDTTGLKRKWEYLSLLLYGKDNVDERALFGYGFYVDEQFYYFFETARKSLLKIGFKADVRSAVSGIVTAAITVLVAFLFLEPVLHGEMTMGYFMAIISAVFNLEKLFTEQLHETAKQLTQYAEFLMDLAEYESLKEEEEPVAAPLETPVFESLAFENVSFKYPGSEEYVLSGLSFRMEAGKHYAFVGVNGAGKTTVTKLMTAFYRDFEGDILINGRPIRTISRRKVRSYFSVIYQDFARYGVSLKDNITVGRDDLDPEAAAEQAGLSGVIRTLPKGLDTKLLKIHPDGADLSGGEWQRVAMARALASQAPVRILDEPTAALDPISESQIYENYKDVSRGRTTVFISHRLGSTRLAERIFVIDHGKVAESGNHEELIAQKGLYARMYESQKEWYQ
jgi:ABC-type multidrug transport system fused ATPase/permease subunit